jgi:hypothetical protein
MHDTYWGESSEQLVHQFGATAKRLPRPFDFGDSYADVVVYTTLGDVPMAVFFQMNKATHGLKRIQLKPLRHAVNPPSYRAIATALDAEFGRPDQTCVTLPVPSDGFQAAVQERWRSDHAAVTAIFRDTTLQAFEGCMFGPARGWCGLHGSILVRIAPAAQSTPFCTPPARPRRSAGPGPRAGSASPSRLTLEGGS